MNTLARLQPMTVSTASASRWATSSVDVACASWRDSSRSALAVSTPSTRFLQRRRRLQRHRGLARYADEEPLLLGKENVFEVVDRDEPTIELPDRRTSTIRSGSRSDRRALPLGPQWRSVGILDRHPVVMHHDVLVVPESGPKTNAGPGRHRPPAA